MSKRSHGDDELTSRTEMSFVSFKWNDDGTLDEKKRRLYHSSIDIRIYKGSDMSNPITIKKGSCVYVDRDIHTPCRVDKIWQTPEGEAYFAATWFYPVSEIESLGYPDLPSGLKIDRKHEKDRGEIESRELILSCDQYEYEIGCIEKVCNVQYFDPDHTVSNTLDDETLICRYRMEIDTKGYTIKYISCNETGGPTSSDSDDSPDSDDDEIRRNPIVEGEGSNLRGNIQVGSKYQAVVKQFAPGQTVRSRNPKLMWSPNTISDEDMQKFMNDLADLHTPYLHDKGLTSEIPYSPLPTDETERLMRGNDNKPLTGSTLSTASMLAGIQLPLLRECNVDAVLELLADHNFDTNAALAYAKENLISITTKWSRVEKEIFDENFRRSNGSLRHVAKAIAPTKSMIDVVDYYFRFKIPDQFRRYQETKREQAIRILECIETRRYHEYTQQLPVENDRDSKRRRLDSWADTSVTEITNALDERRLAAKQLLLDVQKLLGKQTMGHVAAVVKELHKKYNAESKNVLFTLLKGQPELQERFLEFLPKHF